MMSILGRQRKISAKSHFLFFIYLMDFHYNGEFLARAFASRSIYLNYLRFQTFSKIVQYCQYNNVVQLVITVFNSQCNYL